MIKPGISFLAILLLLPVSFAQTGRRASSNAPELTEASPESVVAAVKAMNSGVADGGKLDAEGFSNMLVFAKEMGTNFGKEFDAKAAENDLWTNRFVDGAKTK